eukprot:TRINITY_DN4331_c0_g1_i1.p1 TRINITY_DN4331_c0_g1~~TRINITY_DN4331_c0_g1_i1.p1  ORF type:complete len:586 (-),score=156.91 TRINITY_DN4331_c0_g1_i1:56-1744(-)
MMTDVTGMKVMLLDKETKGIVSMVYTLSQIASKDVFLVEHLHVSQRQKMPHLKAICFLRPESQSVQELATELRDPCFGEYHIFFTNIVRERLLQELAEADVTESVKQVQEFFGDYLAVSNDLFSLSVPTCVPLLFPALSWDQSLFERICDGLCSVLLSMKRKPHIRVSASSELAAKVATEVGRRFEQERALYEFRKRAIPPLLLILDRRDDPVTPLLNQWTYQAMLHELLGILNNRVDLRHVPDIKEDNKEAVLNPEIDVFYQNNMFENFGDLGVNIKSLMDEFQRKSQGTQNIASIEDMKRFVEMYPEFRKTSIHVAKHVTLASELSAAVAKRKLFDVSQLEQDLACTDDAGSAYRRVMEKVNDPSIPGKEKLRLVLLFALKYEKQSQREISSLVDLLQSRGMETSEVKLVQAILRYAGSSVRGGDLFSNKSLWKSAKKSLEREIKGVQNVLTQHQPVLLETLDLLLKSKLTDGLFPWTFGSPFRERPAEVFVFVVGGVTYEEARAVSLLNSSQTATRIILGGTNILNSSWFLDDIELFSALSEASSGAPGPLPTLTRAQR